MEQTLEVDAQTGLNEKNIPLVSANEEGGQGKPISHKKRNFLKLGLMLFLLIIGGGGLAFYFKLIENPLGAENKEVKAKEQLKAISIGPTIKLSPLIINLNEQEGRHFLKVTLILEAEQAKWVEEIQAKTSQIINMIIIHLSDKRLVDIHQREAKEILKAELLEKIAKILDGPKVKQIYWEDFLYQ